MGPIVDLGGGGCEKIMRSYAAAPAPVAKVHAGGLGLSDVLRWHAPSCSNIRPTQLIRFKVRNRNGASTVHGGPCAPRENLGGGEWCGCKGVAAVDRRAVTDQTDKRHVENGAHQDPLEIRIRGDRAL